MKEVSKHQARTPHMEKRKAHNGKRGALVVIVEEKNKF